MRMRRQMPGSVMPGIGAYGPRYQDSGAQMNPRVLGFLGRALSLEYSAGQHYLAHAALAGQRGESNYVDGFHQLANEEFTHAAQLTQRLVALGALPSGSVLKPASPAMDIVEALETCQAREIELVNLYAQAAQYAANIGSGEDNELFARLHEEETRQLEQVGQWLMTCHQSGCPTNMMGGW
ncbi:MAG: ferritin-like domain-containing protein [Pseudomonadota bacterium]